MPIRITLDLFSGRPNPTVTLSDREAKSILARLAPDKKLSRDQAESPPSLGYRGLIIEQSGRPGRGLPRVFRLSADRLYGANLAHLVAEPGLEEELLTRPGFLKKFGVRGLTPGSTREAHPLPLSALPSLALARPLPEAACLPVRARLRARVVERWRAAPGWQQLLQLRLQLSHRHIRSARPGIRRDVRVPDRWSGCQKWRDP
jgi:hypothetical protein